jgi:hypothetical protein
MARFLCALSATLILGTRLLPAADDAAEKKEPAYDCKESEERDEILHPLVDESMELTRSVASDRKHGRTPSKEALTRLDELQLQIEILHAEETGRTRKAQAAEEAPDEPSDSYFRGWLLCRDAEKLKTKGHLADSREKLKKALKIFEQIAKEHPDWKPQMVQSRLAKTKEDLTALPASGD